MTATLEQIVSRKRVEVAKAKANTPLDTLQGRVREAERARNFFAAVVDGRDRDRGHSHVIAEIKRKSPSAGEIRRDFDPVVIAQQYHDAGAAAISCLTDEPDFGGHLGYIQRIKDVTPLPVLRKDFLVDPYQVWESRAAGADAVLLIAEVLGEGELLDMMILARDLGMTSLVEAHSLDMILKIKHHIGFPHRGYSLLGINNRNLVTMKTDVGHTIRVIEFIEDRRVVVSESGITTAMDLARLRKHGVRIALVGEHLLRQPHPGDALRDMLRLTSDLGLSEAG
jgi:indole-3-glycerol phosphate synthase